MNDAETLKKKLNILFVGSSALGGSGIVARRLAIEMDKIGHGVHFVTFEPSTAVECKLLKFPKSISVHYVKPIHCGIFAEPLYETALTEKIIEVISSNSIDVIHAHYGLVFGSAALAAVNYFNINDSRRPKFVLTLHGTDVIGNDALNPGKDVPLRVMRSLLRQADVVTAVSENLKKWTQEIYGTFPVQVVRNATPRILGTGVSVPLADRKKQFVHVSNFRKIKNVETLVQAFASFSAKYPEYKLILVGVGPELPVVQELVKILSLERQVVFKLACQESEIISLLSESVATVLSSLYESCGLVLLESFLSGTPVIASAVGGIPEVVVSGQHGYLVSDPKNAEEFAGAFESITSDEIAFSAMVQQCINRAGDFGVEKMIQGYVDVYKEILHTS